MLAIYLWVLAGFAIIIGELALYMGVSETLVLFIRAAARLEPPPQHGDQFHQMEVEARSAAKMLVLAFGIFLILPLVLVGLITLK